MDSLTLVILAAGSARRYGSLKQLAPVGPEGEALLEYAAFDALGAGFSRLVLVIRKEHEGTFQRRFEGGLGQALELVFAYQRLVASEGACDDASEPQRTKPWGTAHAVLSGCRQIDGPFAVVNADDFYGRSAYAAMARRLTRFSEEEVEPGVFRGAVMGYAVESTLSPEGPVSRALLRTAGDQRLVEVHELPAVQRRGDEIRARRADGSSDLLEPDARVSMNMWGFDAGVRAHLAAGFDAFRAAGGDHDREYLLPGFVNEAIAAGCAQIDVLPTAGPWTGMTFEADRKGTQRFLADLTAQGDYPSPLWPR